MIVLIPDHCLSIYFTWLPLLMSLVVTYFVLSFFLFGSLGGIRD